MLKFIRRIRQRRRERRDNWRYLQCGNCAKKFWGEICTSNSITAFSCRCPHCHHVVEEDAVTLTRRQKIKLFVGVFLWASWNVLIYPIKPLTATAKVVKLEKRVVEEISRVEEKVDEQGRILFKRLDVQDHALNSIAGLISNIGMGVKKAAQIFFKAPEIKAIGNGTSRTEFMYRNQFCSGVISRSRDWTHKLDLRTHTSQRWHSSYLFHSSFGCWGQEVYQIFSLHFHSLGTFLIEDMLKIIENGSIRITDQGVNHADYRLSSLLSEQTILPYVFAVPLCTEGNSFQIEFIINDFELKENVTLEFILKGIEINDVEQIAQNGYVGDYRNGL